MEGLKSIPGGEIFTSIFTLFCTFLFLQTTVITGIVGDQLIASDIVSSPTYAKTFPALHSLEDYDGDKVIAIGSSIIQYSVDGKCIMEEMTSDAGVFNLGISGANPYTEILQIPALIRASPELVMIDLGPNSLWNYYESESLNDYIEFRFTINSILMKNQDIGEWYDLILDEHKQWIAVNDIERMEMTQSYSHRAIEKSLIEFFQDHSEYITYSERSVKPGDADWYDFLMTPNFLSAKYELLDDSEVKQLIDDKMQSKKKQGVYNPKFNGTFNHDALEYMLQKLTQNGIQVMLVATPHHPYVYPNLDSGQLDGFNHTINDLGERYNATVLNMYWETWEGNMFRDRSHLGDNGREYFCERVAPEIDKILGE